MKIKSLYLFFFFVGKIAVFKAVITGNPTPTVTWARDNEEINEETYQIVFDKSSGEHQLKVRL